MPRQPKPAVASQPLRLFVCGFGRVGTALATQASRAGVTLVGIETRDVARARDARRLRGAANGDLAHANLVALTVPDSALAAVVATLLPRLRRGQVVFHCSGSLTLSPLAAVEAAGALPASLHPYCSIASGETPLKGAACALDGSPRARATLRKLALAVGLRPLAKPPTDRLRYHLSAVLTVASAGVASLAAARLLAAAGTSDAEARHALAEILRSVAFNLDHASPAAALTGPFARGDVTRIRQQLNALRGDADALALYRAVGRFSAHAAMALSEADRTAVEAVLKEPPPDDVTLKSR